VLEGFTDSSWITNSKDYSSTSGWVYPQGVSSISWGSKKQICIANSTMDAEFVALGSTCKEVEWLRNLVYEMSLWPKPMSPISIRCDSAIILAKAYRNVYNGKSRHIRLRYIYVRQLIIDRVITVEFIKLFKAWLVY